MPVSLSKAGPFLLACDTTQGACSVAITKGDELLKEIIVPMARGHAEAIMPMIIEVLEEVGVAPAQLERLAVTTGPGTFTGVRLGLAACRAYAVALDVPLMGIPTMQAMAQAATVDQPVFVAIDARRDELYCQLFSKIQSPQGRAGLTSPLVIARDALAQYLPDEPFAVIGTGASFVLDQSSIANLSDAPEYPQARYVASMAGAQNWSDLSAQTLPEPIYLRAADATLPDPNKRPAHAVVQD